MDDELERICKEQSCHGLIVVWEFIPFVLPQQM
jgi:hypothetical protein